MHAFLSANASKAGRRVGLVDRPQKLDLPLAAPDQRPHRQPQMVGQLRPMVRPSHQKGRATVLAAMADAKNIHQLVYYRLQNLVNMVRLGIVGSQAETAGVLEVP